MSFMVLRLPTPFARLEFMSSLLCIQLCFPLEECNKAWLYFLTFFFPGIMFHCDSLTLSFLLPWLFCSALPSIPTPEKDPEHQHDNHA